MINSPNEERLAFYWCSLGCMWSRTGRITINESLTQLFLSTQKYCSTKRNLIIYVIKVYIYIMLYLFV